MTTKLVTIQLVTEDPYVPAEVIVLIENRYRHVAEHLSSTIQTYDESAPVEAYADQAARAAIHQLAMAVHAYAEDSVSDGTTVVDNARRLQFGLSTICDQLDEANG